MVALCWSMSSHIRCQQGRPTRTAVAVTTQRLKETKDAVKLAVTSAAESVYQQLEDRFPHIGGGGTLHH